jgi:hypothetical protein
MKSDVSRFQKFENIMIPGVKRQINIGTNINTSCILIFTSNTHSIYEMFYKASCGSGSAKAELWKDNQQHKEVSVIQG